MDKILARLAATALLCLGSQAAMAHGGQYRGGISLVPPATSSETGSASSPALEAPSSGDTGPPAPPAGPLLGGRAGTPLGGTPIPRFDPNEWTFWWEFNKDPYLDLRQSLFSDRGDLPHSPHPGGLGNLFRIERGQPILRPSREQLRALAVPALRRALEQSGSRDVTSACLIALAKIGRIQGFAELLRSHMTSRDQEIAETAILAHGIARLETSLAELLEIFQDTPRGRELVGDAPRVNFRKQAFAGYALGLIAQAARGAKTKRTVFEAARSALVVSDSYAGRDVLVAAMGAIRLLEPDLSRPDEALLALDAGRFLLDFFKRRQAPFQVRAHAPTALSRLFGRGAARMPMGPAADGILKSPRQGLASLHAQALRLFSRAVADRSEHDLVVQSCVLALGQMAEQGDPQVLRVLARTASGEHSKDIQARSFALIALGSLGGEEAQSDLLHRLGGPGPSREKPWIALGLGVLARETLSAGGQPDPALGAALMHAFDRMRNPLWKAGIGLALGLARHQEAGPMLLETLNTSRDPELRGYLAVALGLMRFQEALEDLIALQERAVRLPVLFRQATLGLGLLRDRSVVGRLLSTLATGSRTVAAQAPVASALGLLGDQRSVAPLAALLMDQERAQLARAFGAVALGLLGDKDDLPWNSNIGFGLNYRAGVETLSGSAGILDLF